MQRIEVWRQYSPLSEAVWQFWFDDDKARLVLDSYLTLARPSLRHKMKIAASYRRLDTRGSNMTVDEVPWDAEIEHAAMAELMRHVTVAKKQ